MSLSGVNICKYEHKEPTLVIDAKSADYNTLADLTQINCNGYNKLMVWYQISAATWDRAGDIIVYGTLWWDDTDANTKYVPMDNTIENATFTVSATDDTDYVNRGQVYVVENIPPFIKIGWNNTTAGTTATISVWVMPFN